MQKIQNLVKITENLFRVSSIHQFYKRVWYCWRISSGFPSGTQPSSNFLDSEYRLWVNFPIIRFLEQGVSQPFNPSMIKSNPKQSNFSYLICMVLSENWKFTYWHAITSWFFSQFIFHIAQTKIQPLGRKLNCVIPDFTQANFSNV